MARYRTLREREKVEEEGVRWGRQEKRREEETDRYVQ
jgi:hypothetical protein